MRVFFDTFNIKNPKQNGFLNKGTSSANFSTPVLSKNDTLSEGEYFRANFYPLALNFTSSNRVQRKDVPIVRFDESIRCPCCGERMKKFNRNEARKLALDISKKSGDELSEILTRNMKNFQANKRNLVREIVRLAPKRPDKKLPALLGILSDKYIDNLRVKQVRIAMQIPKQIEDLSFKDKVKIMEWQISQVQRIVNASEEGDFRNKLLVTSFINFADREGIKIDEKKVRDYFTKLPNSKKDPAAFAIKYKRRVAKEAAYNLIKNAEPTIEHIIPFSESGNNHAENLLVMCSDCNTMRGDMSYDDFIALHPNMLQNIDKYFADIKKVLSASKTRMSPENWEKYKTYVEDVQKTLENYSSRYFDYKHKNSAQTPR